MPYRTFADEQGRSWEIWDVRPERIERRGAERRQERTTPWTGLERRVSDRRQKREARMRLTHPLSEGWLVFKSDEEKRRLSPIPANWESLRGQDLRALWERAEVIGTRIREESA
jgi:hypothetical protein